MPLNGTSARSTYRDVDPFIFIIPIVGIIVVGVVVLFAANATSPKTPPITDPRKGVVSLSEYSNKYCDGTTLVYEIDRGGTAIPNSPECQR
jgi:hypothetical protein